MLSQFYCGYNQIITYLRVKETKTDPDGAILFSKINEIITYLRVKETKTYVVFSKTTDNCLIITYLRVKETKT